MIPVFIEPAQLVEDVRADRATASPESHCLFTRDLVDIVKEEIFILGKESERGGESSYEPKTAASCVSDSNCVAIRPDEPGRSWHVRIRKDNDRSPCVPDAEVTRSGWPSPVRGAQIESFKGPRNPSQEPAGESTLHVSIARKQLRATSGGRRRRLPTVRRDLSRRKKVPASASSS